MSTAALKRSPRKSMDAASLLAFAVLAGLFLVAVLGVFMPTDGVNRVGFGPRMAPPFADGGWLILGTDQLGRPMIIRLMQGVQVTFAIAAVSAAIASAIAATAGLVSGYFGGVIDWTLSRIAELLFTFPNILLALLVVAVLRPGMTGAVLSIVLVVSPQVFRVVRARTIELKPREFLKSAFVYGASPWRIIRVHLLPNIMGVVIIQGSSAMVIAMLIESSLSFLGLGVVPPTASLGSLVYEGYSFLSLRPWLVFVPAAVLSLAIMSVSLAGDWLRDRLEVRDLQVLP